MANQDEISPGGNFQKLLENPLHENNLHTISKNLSGCKLHDCFNDQAVNILNTMCSIIQWWSEAKTRISQQQLQLSVRVILQVVQRLQQTNGSDPGGGHRLQPQLCEMIKGTLLNLIDNQKCSVECAMLAGTCFVRFVCLVLSIDVAADMLVTLFFPNRVPSASMHVHDTKEHFDYNILTDSASMKRSNFLTLGLVNGLLNSGCSELWLQVIDNQPLLWTIFPLVSNFCATAVDNQFTAFQVLLAWLRTVHKYLERLLLVPKGSKIILLLPDTTESTRLPCVTQGAILSNVSAVDSSALDTCLTSTTETNPNTVQILDQVIFCNNSSMFFQVFDIISKNWENFVQGVPDIIFQCFQVLLELHMKESKIRLFEGDPVIRDLVNIHMQLPWTTKRKFPPLAALIPYYGAQKFLQHFTDFSMLLTESLSSNPLASAGTDVYRVLLQVSRQEHSFTKPEEFSNYWESIWLKPFLSALQTKNNIVEQNVLRHWVPWTLKIYPEAFDVIIHSLSSLRCNSYQMAKATVMKHARQSGIVPLEDMVISDVEENLFHACEDVRIQAFALICLCHRKSEPLSATEMHLAYEFLNYNLNIDSAPFRQQLINNTKTLLVRLRDSAISMLSSYKKKGEQANLNQLMMSVEFVQRLLDLVVSNLVPGGSYQRRQTCLDLLQLLLELLASTPDPHKRKGAVPGLQQINILSRYARKKSLSLCELYGTCHTYFVKTPELCSFAREKGLWDFYSESLLETLLCCVLDFMSEIKRSAIRIMAEHFPWHEDRMAAKLCLLMKQSAVLTSSPKNPVCESGALLTSLVCYHYFMSNKGTWIEHLKKMVAALKDQLRIAKENMLLASKTHPMHGLVLTLRLCLTDKDCSQLSSNPLLRQIVSDLLVTNEAIVHHVLNVLASKSSTSATVPSFAEMGEAIDDIIETSASSCSDDTSIPLEHQLVLSCCWLSLKECSSLASKLACTVEWSNAAGPGLLSTEQVRQCGNLLVDVLTQCRHRGAIEACSISLGEYCKHLLESSSSDYETIVSGILNFALDKITSSENTSATRRSAGLPLLILAVVTNEPCSRHRPLLEHCIETLLQIASTSEVLSSQDTVDLPQAHALHVLRAVVQDANLSQAVLPRITQIIRLCISCFAHPAWTVRNAALQLYGSLMPRLLGQKKVRDELSQHNSLTADVLFHRYPDLQSYLHHSLALVAGSQKPAHPCIVPILSLLSRLSPASCCDKNNSIFTTFFEVLEMFLQSPLFIVRRLAAEAIVALNTEWPSQLLGYFVFKLEEALALSSNAVHGQLLVIEQLIATADQQSYEKFDFNKFIEFEGRLRLSEKFPAFIQGTYWTIINDIIDKMPSVDVTALKVEEKLFGDVHENWQPGAHSLAGKMALAMLKTADARDLEAYVAYCFKSLVYNQDFVQAGLSFLQWLLRKALPKEKNLILQHSVLKLVCTHPHPHHMHISINVLIKMLHHSGTLCCHNSMFKSPMVLLMLATIQGHYGTLAAAGGMVLLGHMLRIMLKDNNLCHDVDVQHVLHVWCKQLLLHSQPLKAEDLRLYAAQALEVSNPVLLTVLADESLITQQEELVLQVFDTAILLLTDENCDVRHAASAFAAILPRSEGVLQFESILSNYGIKLLCGYFVTKFWHHSALLNNFWLKISNLTSIGKIVSQQMDQIRNIILFEQEEINIYAEHPMLVQTLQTFIEDIIKKQSDSELHRSSIEAWLKTKVEEVLNDANEVLSLPTIQHILQKKELLCFSAACEAKIFLAILKIRCQVNILKRFVVHKGSLTDLQVAAEKLQYLCVVKQIS